MAFDDNMRLAQISDYSEMVRFAEELEELLSSNLELLPSEYSFAGSF